MVCRSFRAVWAVVKVWVHPITVEKIQVLGGQSKYLPKMEQAGIKRSELPDFMGGNRVCESIADLLEAERQEQQDEAIGRPE